MAKKFSDISLGVSLEEISVSNILQDSKLQDSITKLKPKLDKKLIMFKKVNSSDFTNCWQGNNLDALFPTLVTNRCSCSDLIGMHKIVPVKEISSNKSCNDKPIIIGVFKTSDFRGFSYLRLSSSKIYLVHDTLVPYLLSASVSDVKSLNKYPNHNTGVTYELKLQLSLNQCGSELVFSHSLSDDVDHQYSALKMASTPIDLQDRINESLSDGWNLLTDEYTTMVDEDNNLNWTEVILKHQEVNSNVFGTNKGVRYKFDDYALNNVQPAMFETTSKSIGDYYAEGVESNGVMHASDNKLVTISTKSQKSPGINKSTVSKSNPEGVYKEIIDGVEYNVVDDLNQARKDMLKLSGLISNEQNKENSAIVMESDEARSSKKLFNETVDDDVSKSKSENEISSSFKAMNKRKKKGDENKEKRKVKGNENSKSKQDKKKKEKKKGDKNKKKNKSKKERKTNKKQGNKKERRKSRDDDESDSDDDGDKQIHTPNQSTDEDLSDDSDKSYLSDDDSSENEGNESAKSEENENTDDGGTSDNDKGNSLECNNNSADNNKDLVDSFRGDDEELFSLVSGDNDNVGLSSWIDKIETSKTLFVEPENYNNVLVALNLMKHFNVNLHQEQIDFIITKNMGMIEQYENIVSMIKKLFSVGSKTEAMSIGNELTTIIINMKKQNECIKKKLQEYTFNKDIVNAISMMKHIQSSEE